MDKPAISVNGLTKSFGTKKALNNISFDVLSGETVVITGANGSGKSTLINIIADISTADAGQIKIDGLTNDSIQAKLKRGVVVQEYRVERNFTGLDILLLQGAFYDLDYKYAKERAYELLEFVGLLQYSGKEIYTYSTGMKKRLQIAKALIHNPSILLLDEPTAELDRNIKNEVWGYLNKLKETTNLSVLITTHDSIESKKLGDRVLKLSNGSLSEI